MLIKGIVSSIDMETKKVTVILPEYGNVVTKPISVYPNANKWQFVTIDANNALVIEGALSAKIDGNNVLVVEGFATAEIDEKDVLVVTSPFPTMKVNDFVIVVAFNNDLSDCMIL